MGWCTCGGRFGLLATSPHAPAELSGPERMATPIGAGLPRTGRQGVPLLPLPGVAIRQRRTGPRTTRLGRMLRSRKRARGSHAAPPRATLAIEGSDDVWRGRIGGTGHAIAGPVSRKRGISGPTAALALPRLHPHVLRVVVCRPPRRQPRQGRHESSHGREPVDSAHLTPQAPEGRHTAVGFGVLVPPLRGSRVTCARTPRAHARGYANAAPLGGSQRR